jgi:hypothetical protein
MDGGSRSVDSSRENMQRVGRLIAEVEDVPENVSVLWNDRCLGLIRSQVFENNPSQKPREATTVKAYITELRLFYVFLKSRRALIQSKCNLKITAEDMRAID